MKPTVIANANLNLNPPVRWPVEEYGECLPLQVRRTGSTLASAWLPSPEELAILNAGGAVVLTIFTENFYPPVSVHVE